MSSVCDDAGAGAFAEDGFLNSKKCVLMDRDSKFCSALRDFLKNEGTQPIRLPPRSPGLNAQIERFVMSIKEECLCRMIFFGERSLRRAVQQFLIHYHGERNHQGLENKIIEANDDIGRVTGDIECRERLGGMLNYYYRPAA